MKVVVNTSNVVEKLDLAYSVPAQWLSEAAKETWRAHAAKAASDVQGHPDNSRLMTPPEFEVDINENGYFVTPVGNDWAATHTPLP